MPGGRLDDVNEQIDELSDDVAKLDEMSQQLDELTEQVQLLNETLLYPRLLNQTLLIYPQMLTPESVAEDAITEMANLQVAIYAAIADLSLGTVGARSTYNDFSSGGGCGLTGGTVPANFLYPQYMSFQMAGNGRIYSWDTTGLVSSP
ncbi:MAG: hypothetical protein O2783_07330 [Chloroflexi bacterium]|nr:hypothetical protein [Chloroflexota bacterium]